MIKTRELRRQFWRDFRVFFLNLSCLSSAGRTSASRFCRLTDAPEPLRISARRFHRLTEFRRASANLRQSILSTYSGLRSRVRPPQGGDADLYASHVPFLASARRRHRLVRVPCSVFGLRKAASPTCTHPAPRFWPPQGGTTDLYASHVPFLASARRRHRLVRVLRPVFGLRKAAPPTCTRPAFRFWPPQGGATDLYASHVPFLASAKPCIQSNIGRSQV